MIKASIIGISGYGGIELYRILSKHPGVKIQYIYSESNKGEKLGKLYPQFLHHDLLCVDKNADEIVNESDVVFTSVPHGGASFEYAIAAKKYNKKFIDLSADFRIKDKNIYEKHYETTLKLPDLLKEAVYGLPELNKNEIKSAWLVANPGCYTTAGILSNAPLIKEEIIDINSIIIDAKSGASGAGKKIKQNLHFSELDESFSAYSITNHRHTPEIEQELSKLADKKIYISFIPNLVPMIRGILSISYSKPIKSIKSDEYYDIFKEFYKNCPFVRIKEDLPNTKYVAGSNFIDIAIKLDERTNTLIVVSAIDNLIKGASGQAIQNMNIMFDLDEKMGLDFIGVYP